MMGTVHVLSKYFVQVKSIEDLESNLVDITRGQEGDGNSYSDKEQIIICLTVLKNGQSN